MTVPKEPFMPAPKDDSPSHVEHAVALTGLGPTGILLGLAVADRAASVAELVRIVENVQHQSPHYCTVELEHEGSQVWEFHKISQKYQIDNARILDPRSFVDAHWGAVFSSYSPVLGALLAAGWLLESRLEVRVRDLNGA